MLVRYAKMVPQLEQFDLVGQVGASIWFIPLGVTDKYYTVAVINVAAQVNNLSNKNGNPDDQTHHGSLGTK